MKNLWRQLNRPETERAARILGTTIICLSMLGMAAIFRSSGQAAGSNPLTVKQTSAPTSDGSEAALPTVDPNQAHASAALLGGGIPRLALLHTTLPDRPRFEVIEYTVKTGDTIFDIATRFGLKPSTLLWGNLNRLGDNPEMIQPDQKLNILPVDGVYYQWSQGDGLTKVAQVLGVTPDDIITFPGNHLNPDTIGELSHPNIPVGTWIVVPGGYRNFITWSAPTISRFNPGVARLYGPGQCTKPTDGAVGSGTFTFPTVDHWLSGYDYTPEANHPAVDFGGAMGNAIYAADNGVVVYAGWNDWGYGNVTVIDHGNGYQTLYGHQSRILVGCGQSVFRGDLIGNMGSTGNSSGPHLHFEMWYNGVHVSPHQFLAITSN
ncbi:MAG TPA: peptidoglycan DD-metalloendopeptidase family protein [Anaerolineaceae bacterium]